ISTAQSVGLESRESEIKPGAAGQYHAVTQPTVQSDRLEGRDREVSDVPEPVLKDLASLNPSTRLRALNYWDVKGSKLSLDSIFEAMEDEDEAVRARATAIIDLQWAIEQEVIELTFSTTKSIGGQLIRRP
ncbi:MAG TPA: hypothetical protein VFX10_04095, partial [Nitrospira sp.]|nr:hypothetical protein [Nitrospira sp.]